MRNQSEMGGSRYYLKRQLCDDGVGVDLVSDWVISDHLWACDINI